MRTAVLAVTPIADLLSGFIVLGEILEVNDRLSRAVVQRRFSNMFCFCRASKSLDWESTINGWSLFPVLHRDTQSVGLDVVLGFVLFIALGRTFARVFAFALHAGLFDPSGIGMSDLAICVAGASSSAVSVKGTAI